MLFTNTDCLCFAKDPAVVRYRSHYWLYYSLRHEDGRFGIGIAESADMEHWTPCGEIEQDALCETNGIAAPGAIVLNDKIHLFYQTYGNWEKDAICHAWSQDGIHFTKNPENPVFHPAATWCCGRAIDADVCVFGGKMHMYFATRDHAMRIQKIGGAWAKIDSDFGRNAWHPLAEQSLLMPELAWEGDCVEAPATVVEDGKIYLFYGGSYNCTPQQIGCAVSEDGIFFRRVSNEPLIPCGAPGTWNSSESGHPYAFRDDDGRVFLFYQGSSDNGKTWYISRKEVQFGSSVRILTSEVDSGESK